MTDVHSANYVFLVGHVAGKITKTPSKKGSARYSFTLATNELFFDHTPEKKKPRENAEFHPIIAWGVKGERIKKWAYTGQAMIVVGKLRHKALANPEPDGSTRRISYVELDSFTWLGRKKDLDEDEVGEEKKDPI